MSFNTYRNIKNEVEKYNNFIIVTCVDNIPASTEAVYLNEGFDIYCYLHSESRNIKQLEYNSNIEAVIYSGGNSRKQGLLIDGQAEIISNYEDEKDIRSKFMDKFQSMRAFIKSEDSTLVKITPLEIKRIENKKLGGNEILKFRENAPSAGKKILSSMGRWFRKWFQATRLGFTSTTVGALILGMGIAYHVKGAAAFGNFTNILLACLGAILAHVSSNLFNDYYDNKNGTDRINTTPTPFSGGSRVIQNGIISPEKILMVAWFLLVAAIAIGLYLNSLLPGNWLLLIGGIGILLVYFYSAPPLKLAERGLGEIAVGLGFGIVIELGLYYVIIGKLAWLPVIASVPLGILVFLVLFINEFQDSQFDRNSEKRHLVTRFKDKRNAVQLYKYLMFLPYLWVIGFVVAGLLPLYTLLVLLLLPLSFKAVSNAVSNYDRIYELMQTNGLTIGVHILFSILFTVGFLLESLI